MRRGVEPRNGIHACESDFEGYVGVEDQQMAPVEAPAQAIEPGIVRGAGKQRNHIGDDAGDAAGAVVAVLGLAVVGCADELRQWVAHPQARHGVKELRMRHGAFLGHPSGAASVTTG